MMQRKVTKGRDELAAKLSGIKAGQYVLVFDGKKGEAEQEYGEDPFVVITNGGDEQGEGRVTADDWIIAQLDDVECDVQVVTADKVRVASHSAGLCALLPAPSRRLQ